MALALDDTVGLLRSLGDPTRVRLLHLLDAEEFSVAELTRITELPQSRVSTHLGKLRDCGLLRDRKAGGSTFYAVADEGLSETARRLWHGVRDGVDDETLEGDRRRKDAVVSARSTRTRGWPDEVAGQMERHYSPGRTWEATTRGLIGLLDLGDVLDIGSGDGVNAQLLAARAKQITCLDRSERVIEAARARLDPRDNVDFVIGDMHELPFDSASFDRVLCFNVLVYSREPARALAEAARVLRPGGLLAVVTLAPHDYAVVADAYDHETQGHAPEDLREWLDAVGLDVTQCEVTSRERRKPYFQVVSACARRPSKQS